VRDEDVEENLSLRTKLHTDFQVELPPFPDSEELDPDPYFHAVAQAIDSQPGWKVHPDAVVLGCFSFAKLLLYRDLDPQAWPADRPLFSNPFIPALLGNGFPPAPDPIPDGSHLDEWIPSSRLDHVVDADASQTVAIEQVRQGRNIVLHGPPGTGKSQSITNIIATAVLDGKKVLFVAEKLAALEVVQRRLQREGLGDLCLELHSNKASKRAVIEEIGRTWRLGKPKNGDLSHVLSELESRRAALNTHCSNLHQPHPKTGLTPYSVIGDWIRLPEVPDIVATIDLEGAETWPPAERAERENLIAEIGDRILELGPPSAHPWRGIGRETLLPSELPKWTQQIQTVVTCLNACRLSARQIAKTFGLTDPPHLEATRRLSLCARHASQAPDMDRAALGHPVWESSRADLRELVNAGRQLHTARQALGSRVTEAAWEKDFEPARATLAAHGESLLRFLNGPYRAALAELRSVATTGLPESFQDRLAYADHLIAGQRAMRVIRQFDDLGAAAFGTRWRQTNSDWPLLERIVGWVEGLRNDGLGSECLRSFASLARPEAAQPLAAALTQDLERFIPALHGLVADLNLDLAEAFLNTNVETVTFDQLEIHLAAWLRDPRSVFTWIQYYAAMQRAANLRLASLAQALHSGAVPPTQARIAFQHAFYARLLRELTQVFPSLARFDGASHSRLVDEFRRVDRERLALARFQTVAAHHTALPPLHAGVGAVGIVTSELERKRGHRPVRQLLRDAASVVQAIKPVFMMSPLSVAQFLPPGAIEFDLLVIDEASQVQPVDALGAIARSRQIVVVGDSRQLPPTRFFARVTGEDSDAVTESGAAGMQDIESILGLCSARGLPATMLQWHYRSRHHSLIAVSNREFYADKLFVVPSPRPTAEDLGLQLQIVSDGVFDSGGTGTNRVEAKAVCRAVMDHARRHPGLSLGVAAFSVRQQQAILDELELLRRETPATEPFFNDHPNEPFFVKNLENVQGDERDVVFISIGYGRDPDGFLRMNFGPLGAEGGERRLNVLISRARRRCVVFSSIRAADIDLERVTGRGVQALKAFLAFAETGQLEPGGTDPHSRAPSQSFEQAVQATLTAHGHQVAARVGIAGFFIDLAVADPERPGRYLLGIECDGHSYRQSRSARDRDRLRPAVLQNHGWRLHQLWILDWFQRPDEQLRRISDAITKARAEALRENPPPAPPAPEPEEIDRESPTASSPGPLPEAVGPYALFNIAPPAKSEPIHLPPAELSDWLLRIVDVEGPIHEDELVVRIRDLWKLPRAGARLQDVVARGVRALLVAQRCIREEGCLDLPDRPVRVRSREGISSPNLRKPDLLPPSEIRAAILHLVEAAHGVERRELPTAVARLLGFRTTPASLRSLVEQQASRLESDKHLELQSQRWVLPRE